jgi:DNA (cytosine-5)-methyltransferase 1
MCSVNKSLENKALPGTITYKISIETAMTHPIKIIDLFSGPGGLSEGFSALKVNGKHVFKNVISIEKEDSAHRTLTLRAFFRQFPNGAPSEYYSFLRGELGKTPEEQLYKIEKFSKQIDAAREEAQKLTLGKDNKDIYKKIRKVISPSEDCILIGGPPCQAYSLAGQARNKNNDNYDARDDHRNFLYKEYLKVIARFQPKMFVMENVKGMLSAKIDGHPIFEGIREDLCNPCKAVDTRPVQGRKKHRYKICSLVQPDTSGDLFGLERDAREYIIRSENYSTPQKRHRVIILGIREDIARNIDAIDTLPLAKHKITTQDVIGDLPKLRSGLSKIDNTNKNWLSTLRNIDPALKKELKKLKLDDVYAEIKKSAECIKVPKDEQGSLHGLQKTSPLRIKRSPELERWLKDEKMNNHVVNHETRGHLEADLHRYLFSSCWATVAKKNNWDIKFPKSKEYPDSLKPKHKNFDSGKFSDRFRVQLSDKPATTITSHISKDGHYFIHYDPLQCRSLTVREAARIQTFPDNYFFVGNRTQQYVQVGNAVPPYLANQIAKMVANILK